MILTPFTSFFEQLGNPGQKIVSVMLAVPAKKNRFPLKALRVRVDLHRLDLDDPFGIDELPVLERLLCKCGHWQSPQGQQSQRQKTRKTIFYSFSRTFLSYSF